MEQGEAATGGRPPRLVYDKGERRHKHVSRSARAEIVFERGNPKRAVGRCPNDIDQTTREALLQTAIPSPNGDRDLDAPRILYAVYQGVIYEARTSDGGRSYHAYPYHGPLSGRLIRSLRDMTVDSGFEEAFEAWIRTHIEPRGRWR
jgi:hypothetical protein